MPQPKIFVQTYGCQMNVYDSQKMVSVMASSVYNMEKTEQIEEADFVIMNTCSIRDKAEHKVLSEAGRWRTLKDKNPDIVLAIGGCVASQEGDQLLRKAPYIDIVFGPQTLHRLPELYHQVKQSRIHVCDVSFPSLEKFDHFPKPNSEGPSAYVSIMEGCSKYCSFCIVPYTRGEELSRPVAPVLQEIYQLTQQGVKEIVLLGQNVNDYAGDLDGETIDLAGLIHLVSEFDGIERIRFTTSHPSAFSDELIEAYRTIPKLVNHLHLPVQSGSDRILTAMKRGYSVARFEERIAKLREVRPDIAISSDFIVGFPGETDEDFTATMDLVSRIGFDHSYAFIYSPRPGTPAAALEDTTPMTEKKQRLSLLQQRLQRQGSCISEAMVGKPILVLITGRSKQGNQLQGRSENNRIVNLDGPDAWIGQMHSVIITSALKFSLQGKSEENIAHS
jgi:tRNA-2-methylthio-N6-dimethylallyladenosine synthase